MQPHEASSELPDRNRVDFVFVGAAGLRLHRGCHFGSLMLHHRFHFRMQPHRGLIMTAECSRMDPGIGHAALDHRCCPIGSALDGSFILLPITVRYFRTASAERQHRTSQIGRIGILCQSRRIRSGVTPAPGAEATGAGMGVRLQSPNASGH